MEQKQIASISDQEIVDLINSGEIKPKEVEFLPKDRYNHVVELFEISCLTKDEFASPGEKRHLERMRWLAENRKVFSPFIGEPIVVRNNKYFSNARILVLESVKSFPFAEYCSPFDTNVVKLLPKGRVYRFDLDSHLFHPEDEYYNYAELDANHMEWLCLLKDVQWLKKDIENYIRNSKELETFL